jgi:hypothetical protein
MVQRKIAAKKQEDPEMNYAKMSGSDGFGAKNKWIPNTWIQKGITIVLSE